MKYLTLAVALTTGILLTSCDKPAQASNRKSGVDVFVKNYNSHIKEYLSKESLALAKKETELNTKLSEAKSEEEKKAIRASLKDLARLKEKIEFRQSLKDYISFKTLDDVPEGLQWDNGMDNPEIGDPRAKKGGTFHNFVTKFPETLRPIGPNSNHSARGYIYDDIRMGLVSMHPITNNFIPALAKEWAISSDRRTVYYKLDPKATFSDGQPVTAKDYLCGLYIRLSDDISAPFEKEYLKNQIANLTIFDEHLISISLPQAKPLTPYYASLAPSPSKFYASYGPDYKDRYQWKVEPTTGAYTVLPENIKKGRGFTLTRVKNWWAKDKKFFKYTCNVDKISYQVIAERSKAFELFRLGKLDSFSLARPAEWYDRMEIDEYFKGYIEKVQFYNVYPRVPRGIYLNLAIKPLEDKNIRIGIAHALDFKKVNTVVYRGDASRLDHFSEGFGGASNPDIKARKFSPTKAKEYFAKAGYTKHNDAGYLIDGAGKTLKLEITYRKDDMSDEMLKKLKEQAKKAGLEIRLDVLPSPFPKMQEKKHQSAYSGWAVRPPFPNYHQFFHSSNAYDGKGNVRTQTNNMNSYRGERMDYLCDITRAASTIEEFNEAAKEIQQIIHDEALFIPALKTAYGRIAHWRWVKWPQTKQYEFCSPGVYTPTDSYLYWIDEEVKKETLEAKKAGKEFPEENHNFDLYRNGIPSVEELEARKLKSN